MVPSCQRVCLLPLCGPRLFSFQGSVPHTSNDSSRHPGLRVLSGVHTRVTHVPQVRPPETQPFLVITCHSQKPNPHGDPHSEGGRQI